MKEPVVTHASEARVKTYNSLPGVYGEDLVKVDSYIRIAADEGSTSVSFTPHTVVLEKLVDHLVSRGYVVRISLDKERIKIYWGEVPKSERPSEFCLYKFKFPEGVKPPWDTEKRTFFGWLFS